MSNLGRKIRSSIFGKNYGIGGACIYGLQLSQFISLLHSTSLSVSVVGQRIELDKEVSTRLGHANLVPRPISFDLLCKASLQREDLQTTVVWRMRITSHLYLLLRP